MFSLKNRSLRFIDGFNATKEGRTDAKVVITVIAGRKNIDYLEAQNKHLCRSLCTLDVSNFGRTELNIKKYVAHSIYSRQNLMNKF